ncbi:hypothetical protein RvY_03447 [Ramazzottius varieornatus]|uniref:Uncharacterized protein n=1 Tax=Ramazzottius varieornatus TaxID=947166 RepID=A0A1D1UTU4_RAMVA|nr:hypothetical protein RvY_03447 [Ramazzottius varieornatus]
MADSLLTDALICVSSSSNAVVMGSLLMENKEGLKITAEMYVKGPGTIREYTRIKPDFLKRSFPTKRRKERRPTISEVGSVRPKLSASFGQHGQRSTGTEQDKRRFGLDAETDNLLFLFDGWFQCCF